MFESLVQDIRYALRSFRKSPIFAAGVVGTIGLGLGFVCSSFTVVNGYLLKPFDLPDPYALHELTWDSGTVRGHRFSIDDLTALDAATNVFSGVVGFAPTQISVDDGVIYGQIVTGNYFVTLGVRPFLGRVFEAADAAQPGAGAVAVLSHSAWLARFGADPSIIGRDVRLGRSQFTVIGVAQPGFSAFGEAPISFFVPLTMAAAFPVTDPYAPERPAMFTVLARLRSGVTAAAAQAWLNVWLKQRLTGTQDLPIVARVESRATRIPVTPKNSALFSAVVAAFGLVFLIACANVANMMLARGLGRQREIAVRLSLGAARARVVRQLLIESLLCAAPAALVGYALTYATGRVFPVLLFWTWPDGLPPVQGLLAPMEPDARVVGFLMLTAVISAICFGLSPALQATNTSLIRAARGEFGAYVRASRVRNALVVAQIAACALFLVTASILLSELKRVSNTVRGVNVDDVADLRVDLEYRSAMVERLSADPRVASVTAVWRPPFYGPLRTVQVMPEGSGNEVTAGFMVASPEYFEALDVPLLRGRVFTRAEADAQADVALVSEATARRLWPNAEAIGQTLQIRNPGRSGTGARRPSQPTVRIIGVTADVISGSILDGVDRTCIYFPTSVAVKEDAALLLRARTDIASLRAAVTAARIAVREDAAFPLYPLRQVLGVQIWAMQIFSAIVSLVGVGALLLAFSGTYGVIAYLVIQRTREFGIRMALGATVPGVVRSVLGEAIRLGARGMVIGGLLALALSRALASVVEIMPPFSVTPYVVGALIVLLAMLTAALVPSLRASRVDPAVALRNE